MIIKEESRVLLANAFVASFLVEFINSLDLRNMYSHGTQPFGNENIHYSNYIRFLKLFILIIIKINDELCIKDDIKKGEIDE